MDYATAASITAEYAPDLVIDPPVAGLPNLMNVRKVAGGSLFSITLPEGGTPEKDREFLIASIDLARQYLG